ncbi:Tannase/feruloyl esterase [Camillea tinctor]|nr:Tannase/feruloyl esterase [Camillea tinctor]
MFFLKISRLWALGSLVLYWAIAVQSIQETRQSAATECSTEYFTRIAPSGIDIERVQYVTNGFFFESGNLGYPSIPLGLPYLCAIIVRNTTANYRFGMFLPNTWNSKLLTIGSYAFLGGINWLDMGSGVKYGMATLSTDTGHNTGRADMTWANTTERRVNWAYQALEVKQIQRDPNIFDGALIGAPAWDTKHLMPWLSNLARLNLPEEMPNSINNVTLFARLQAEVIRQCDHLDGVTDNIVSSTTACRDSFDITKVRCDTTTGEAACWSQQEIDTALRMYDDYVTDDGKLVYKGATHSSEGEWSTYLLPAEPENFTNNVRINFDGQYERYFMNYGPDWDIYQYNDSTVTDSEIRDETSVQATADQYDLGTFRNTGKIILYGGLADAVVPVQHTTLYYDRTVDAMGNIDNFFRYFQIPGMGHCTNTPDIVKAPWMIGGAGQAIQRPPYNSAWSVPLGFNDTQHDALLALMDWVENGNPVSKIIASEFNFTDSTMQNLVLYRQRPLCMYPRTAKWDGKGDQNIASSWECS